MAHKKTIVFVPGAWHSPDGFRDTAAHLQDAGYQCEFVHLASVGASPPLKDFRPDVEVIASAITKAADAGQDVIVVGHSYGSIPACAAIEGLDKKTRQAAGKAGGVVHKIFLCSFLLNNGTSLIQAVGGNAPDWFEISPDEMECKPMTPGATFYNDMPKTLQDKWAATLKPHSYQSMFSPQVYEAWRYVPSSYIYCAKDNGIPLFAQKMMVEQIAQGVDIKTVELDASHSPFLSMPPVLAKTIMDLVEGA